MKIFGQQLALLLAMLAAAATAAAPRVALERDQRLHVPAVCDRVLLDLFVCLLT